MKSSEKAAEFLEVYQRELDEIVRRRREAGLAVPGNDAEARRQVADDMVGLALSGGGVRSASLNLGLLQAMYANGLLQHVDYMSTVSGGGYVGACLSSAALDPETRFDWQKANQNVSPNNSKSLQNSTSSGAVEPSQQTGHETVSEESQKAEADAEEPDERGFSLAVLPDGRQPKRVNELIHSGTSLRRPLLFLNRYLIGVVLTNIVALSGIFTICALAAFLFRCTDYQLMINWLYALGFRGDVQRAFFPATMFFFLWLGMWAISYWRKGAEATGRVARIFLAFTIVSVLMAVAMLVGTGDISLTYVKDNWGIEPPKEALESIGRDLQKLFIFALIVALLPYLRVQDLIRSGSRPRNVFEGWIFAVASRALLYGLPLLVFGCFARENISGFNEMRMGQRHDVPISFRSDVKPLDFADWRGTWRALELQSSTDTAQQTAISNGTSYRVGRRMWELAGEDDARHSIQVVDDMAEFDSEHSYVHRWLLLAGQLVTGEPNALTEQFQRREKYFELRYRITQALTDGMLCSPQTYQLFVDADKDFPGLERDQMERLKLQLSGLLARGEQLEDRIDHLHSRHGVSLAEWLSADPLPRPLDLDTREQYARTEEELKDVNWQLLRTYFGDQLTPKSTVYAATVLIHDQHSRLLWFLGSLGVFIVSGLVVNLNATSLHGFYRNGISKVWINEIPGFGESIPLTRLDTTSRGAPYHLINATVHLMGSRVDLDQPTTDGFLFSRCFCGCKRTGFSPTDHYGNGRYDLPNAIAVSGAAVTPTQAHNPLLAVLLFLSNSRLGQWLPNPAHKDRLSDKVHSRLRLPFSPIRLLIGLFQPAELRNHCFIADGGHHENLGLEPLLERRVRTIIVSDVTCDAEYQFEDLVRLHRRIAAQLGIRIEGLSEPDHFLDLGPLVPARESRHCLQHVMCARIRYPRLDYLGDYGTPMDGLLIYVKPGLTGDESLDLRSHYEHNPSFPHDTTADQFYDPDRFESYRQLGFHLGQQIPRYVHLVDGRFEVKPPSGSDEKQAEVSANGKRPALHRNGATPRAAAVRVPRGESQAPSADRSPDGQRPASPELQLLLKHLEHSHPELQRLAVHSLGEMLPGLDRSQTVHAIDSLLALIERPETDRATLDKAVWALGESRCDLTAFADRILAFVENHSGDVRLRNAALEALRNRSSRPALLDAGVERLLESRSPTIRQTAASLLNSVDTQEDMS